LNTEFGYQSRINISLERPGEHRRDKRSKEDSGELHDVFEESLHKE